MAIPEYLQAEVDQLIAMKKLAAFEGQIYEPAGRFRPYYVQSAFGATAENDSPGIKFKIRTEANLGIGAYCILLEGSIGNRPLEGLCRYDVHDSTHRNNCTCCGNPPEILPGEFHIHRYNECCIRRGNAWHKCASPIAMPNISFGLQVKKLIGVFVTDMQLRFSDSRTRQSMFETGEEP